MSGARSTCCRSGGLVDRHERRSFKGLSGSHPHKVPTAATSCGSRIDQLERNRVPLRLAVYGKSISRNGCCARVRLVEVSGDAAFCGLEGSCVSLRPAQSPSGSDLVRRRDTLPPLRKGRDDESISGDRIGSLTAATYWKNRRAQPVDPQPSEGGLARKPDRL